MLGAINAVSLLYAIGRGVVDAYFAIDEDDYRKAGKIGVQTAIVAGVAIYGTAKGAAAPVAGAEAGAAGAVARGGALAAHEAAGGHTRARHVGWTAAHLDARLAAEPHLRMASSFGTQAEAEAAASSVISQNAARIAEWVLAGAQGRLPLTGGFYGGLIRIPGGYSATGTSATFVLRGNGSGGYYILMGFPTP